MLNKNIDGIKKPNPAAVKKPSAFEPQFLKVDALNRARKIINRKTIPQQSSYSYVVPRQTLPKSQPRAKFLTKLYQQRRVSIMAASVALTLAFTGGMWAALSTPQTAALETPPDQAPQSYSVSLGQVPVGSQETAAVSNDVLFNTPIENLKSYFESVSQPGIIEQRTKRLSDFLKGRNSPLADESEIIAQQTHWKLILAIAFAESTLGQHCYKFNCSGIGGSNIRTYDNSKQWILDFNRLLEKRYKDKTLEQMCGVYVQPCTSSWLMATKQILTALEQKGIE